MKATRNFDVDALVLGGGPAGAVAARMLALGGATVALAERSGYERFRTGETLPPAANALFARLGLAGLLGGHLPSPGTVASWGGESPHENDFIFSRHGRGWHLDRRRFDEALAASAAEAGVDFLSRARAVSCERDTTGRWRVVLVTAAETVAAAARWVIDATGRASWFIRSQGVKRVEYDHLVALTAVLDDTDEHDTRTFIESMPDGWWYATALPAGRAMAAFFTDSDLHDLRPAAAAALWNDRLATSRLVAARLAGTRQTTGLRIAVCSTARATRTAGDGWLAVGDAARSIDPLSSQGILWAVRSGLDAAGVVLDADPAALARHETVWDRLFGDYLFTRQAYYAVEARWPASPFWRRRAGETRSEQKPPSPDTAYR